MAERQATPQRPYRYRLSGLSSVALAGIVVRHCPQCRAEQPVIPRIAELHRAIALDLVRKPGLLEGEEVRFLRKWAGFPARKFAALLGVSPEHLSRIENGQTASFGAPTDRLARAAAVAGRDIEAARDILLRVTDMIDRKRRRVAKPLVFRLERNRWKAAA